jgi:hypothetical protein
MKSIQTRLAVVEVKVEEIEDKHGKEILELRNHKHAQSNTLQKHEGMFDSYNIILKGIKDGIESLTTATEKNTKAIFSFRVMAGTAIFMGGGFIGFVVFVGGQLLHWW